MLTPNILAQSISIMHPLEAKCVEARIADTMAMVGRSLSQAQQKRFHIKFLSSLFDESDADINDYLSELTDVQQAFCRAIGRGELDLAVASGFGEVQNSMDVGLRWDFEDKEGEAGTLLLSFTEDNDGLSNYYNMESIYTVIGGRSCLIDDDAGDFFRDLAESLDIDTEVLHSERCFYANSALPSFGAWEDELIPTKEESSKALDQSLSAHDSIDAMSVMDAYQARHGLPMDYDLWGSLISATRLVAPLEVMTRMVSEGATIDKANVQGLTPLSRAIRVSNRASVEALLSLGADAREGMKTYSDIEGGDVEVGICLEKALLSSSNKKPRPTEGFGL